MAETDNGMNIRRAGAGDREVMLTSFKPLFGDWDYLPRVIDDWLRPSASVLTWLAFAGPALVAMAQAEELEPGDWYLRGLRSNPQARPQAVAAAILGLRQAIRDELKARPVDTVRYGTLEDNQESLRLARLFGFREHFRLAHWGYPLPQPLAATHPVSESSAAAPSVLLHYFRQSPSLPEGYFFTWWHTRRLKVEHLARARGQGLLSTVTNEGHPEPVIEGAALFWHVPWQKFLVFSLMEGTDEALASLYQAGVASAHRLGCRAIGLVHPSLAELHRRQALFGLEEHGGDTVQLILRPSGPVGAARKHHD
jgi:hypothetical protein